MNLLKNIVALFKKPTNDLSEVFTFSGLSEEFAPSLAKFPVKIFLGSQGIYAYRLQFMVSETQAQAVLILISSLFSISCLDTFQEGNLQNKNHESIYFSIRNEFNGAVIDLITNSRAFLKSLYSLDLQPVPPWVVFPQLDPDLSGILQGDVDFWWHWFWLPFWNNLTSEEQHNYLVKHHANSKWLSFLQ